MVTNIDTRTDLSIPRALRVLCLTAGTLAILTTILAVAAFLPEHPDFSPFKNFLSDIGDTPGWPQIYWNSGTLITASIRYLILVLLTLRLAQLGTGRAFGTTVLIIGAFSTFGTVLMTAIPYSVAPAIHKAGIPMYFFGVVPLQIVIGLREWRLKEIPRLLPVICFLLAGSYLVFFVLMILYEQQVVSRTTAITPMIWQWIGFSLSLIWVFAHGLILGRE